MKRVYWLVCLMLFFPNTYAGAITKSIEAQCPDQYAVYENIVHEYAVRMSNYVKTYGCGVVSAYGVFMTKDMSRIQQWEDDEWSFNEVNQVFLFAEKYNLDVAAKPLLYDVLSTLLTSANNQDQLDRVFAQTTGYERRRMSRNPERIFYLMWAMQISQSQKPEDIFRIKDRLHKDFSVASLPTALLLNGSIANIYPEYSAKKRLGLINYVFHTYSKGFMTKLATNKLALPNLVYLLPPQAGDIEGSQGLTDRDIEQLQRNYAADIKEIFKSFKVATDNFGVSVDATAVLAPFVQQALVSAPMMNLSITSYLKNQIHSPVFNRYLKQKGNCKAEDFANYVANFFTFLAPFKQIKGNDSVEPIPYLQNNLAQIANWYHNDANMRAWVTDIGNDPQIFIQNMAWLPYYYEKSKPVVRQYLSKLLYNLPKNPNVNASFILALFKGSDYFEWIVNASDVDTKVNANEDVRGNSAAKYRYILTTPFPAQDDLSVFQRFLHNGTGIAALSDLQDYSVELLSKHEFILSEKIMSTLNNLDNTITVVEILAIPITGGASILLIGAKMAAKQATKKSLKQAVKVGSKYVRETVSHNVSRTTKRLIFKDGKKSFTREAKEMAGLAKKRGRPSQYAGVQAKMNRRIRTDAAISDSIQISLAASTLATALYCQGIADHSSSAWGQSLCHVQDEKDSSENICRNFKTGAL